MFKFNPNPCSIQSISFSFNKTSDNSRLEKTTFPVRKLIIKTCQNGLLKTVFVRLVYVLVGSQMQINIINSCIPFMEKRAMIYFQGHTKCSFSLC